VTPLIFQKRGIKPDSLLHVHACSTQGTVSPKELARPEVRPTGLFLAKRTAIWPQAVSNCQGNPTRVHLLEQPAGLPCSFKVLKSLFTHDYTSGQANTKANRCDSCEKHLVNIKRTTTVVDPAKVRRTPTHVRSMGAGADRARSQNTPE
jgi:hypothetical protein